MLDTETLAIIKDIASKISCNTTDIDYDFKIAFAKRIIDSDDSVKSSDINYIAIKTDSDGNVLNIEYGLERNIKQISPVLRNIKELRI